MHVRKIYAMSWMQTNAIFHSAYYLYNPPLVFVFSFHELSCFPHLPLFLNVFVFKCLPIPYWSIVPPPPLLTHTWRPLSDVVSPLNTAAAGPPSPVHYIWPASPVHYIWPAPPGMELAVLIVYCCDWLGTLRSVVLTATMVKVWVESDRSLNLLEIYGQKCHAV